MVKETFNRVNYHKGLYTIWLYKIQLQLYKSLMNLPSKFKSKNKMIFLKSCTFQRHHFKDIFQDIFLKDVI